MNIAPSDQFLAACRQVLGADDPATILGVLQSRDQQLIARLRHAHADIVDANRSNTPSLPNGNDRHPRNQVRKNSTDL